MAELYIDVPTKWAFSGDLIDYYNSQQMQEGYRALIDDLDPLLEGASILVRKESDESINAVRFIILGSDLSHRNIELLLSIFMMQIMVQRLDRHTFYTYPIVVDASFHIGDEILRHRMTSKSNWQ